MLESPEIEWEDGFPVSRKFGDVFFSREGGAAETKHVFLRGNLLPERWISKKIFSIFETGFGSALNFLETWKRFEETTDGRLFYTSTEKYPWDKKDLARLIDLFPDLKIYLEKLIENYPHRVPGFHRLILSDNITLTLLFGDVTETIPQFQGYVDAWYLDGFAPAKNQDMWSDLVFDFMRQHSVKDSTFATYTAAGFVKRAAEKAGFTVQKEKGFGKKKEMLQGVFTGNSETVTENPWYVYTSVHSAADRVAIIGSGLAGSAIAEAFDRRGIDATLIDKKKGEGASANPRGIFYPFLGATLTWYGRFSIESFGYLLRHLKRTGMSFFSAGVFKYLKNSQEIEKAEKSISSNGLTEDVVNIQHGKTGFSIPDDSSHLYFPDGSIVSPVNLCENNARTAQYIEIEVRSVEQTPGGWKLYDANNNEILETEILVLAAGYALENFPQLEFIPMHKIRGQISFFSAKENSKKLQHVICYDGYTLPEYDGFHVVGATYSENDEDMSVRESDSIALLEKANEHIESSLFSLQQLAGGRVSFRAQTKDRFPVIGPVPRDEWYYENYKAYPYKKDKTDFPKAEYHRGLFISAGHGSRGLLNCHLGAELLVSQILGEPLPVENDVMEEVHPARFIMRNLKRQIFKTKKAL